MSEGRDELIRSLRRLVIASGEIMMTDGFSESQAFGAGMSALQIMAMELISAAPAENQSDIAEHFATEIKTAFPRSKGH